MTSRGMRRMPTMKRLLAYHGIIEPHCRKCLVPVRPELLERAHLIDRARDGLDGPQNLAPLCDWCHENMPSFGNGDEDAVLRWLSTPQEGRYHELVRISASREGLSTSDVLRIFNCDDFHSAVVAVMRQYIAIRGEMGEEWFAADALGDACDDRAAA